MINELESTEVKIARLEEKLDNLTLAIEKMSNTLDNLRMSFVPRSEFDQLSIIVRGIANEGGLVMRVDKLEKKFIYYLGAGAIIIILGLAAWQLLLTWLSKQ